MSYSEWEIRGYGVDVTDLNITPERMVEFLKLDPEAEAMARTFFEQRGIDSPTMDDFECFDEFGVPAIASTIAAVMNNVEENIQFIGVSDFDDEEFVLWVPTYPWDMTGRERTITPDELDAIFGKYTTIISDKPVEPSDWIVKNGG